MIKVMFVCHGNICRSAMAKYIFKDIVKKENEESLFLIDSSATSFEEIGNDVYPYAKKELRKNNIPFDAHKAKRITIKDYEEFDYVLIMDSNNKRNLKNIVNREDKTYMLGSFGNVGEISDPWYTGEFEKCYREIFKSCKGLYEYLNRQ